jgi:uncharacterized protein (DUF433 family)
VEILAAEATPDQLDDFYELTDPAQIQDLLHCVRRREGQRLQ